MKFVLFVEGDTEQRALGDFLKRWLDKRLTRAVGVERVNLNGAHNFCKKLAGHVKRNLRAAGQIEIISCIGLVDLFRLENVLPDLGALPSVDARCKWVRSRFEKEVTDPRFRMHFAVHEIEAWLISQPYIFDARVRSKIPKKAPEEINFDSAPGRVLHEIYASELKRKYKKTIDGRRLFEKLNPEVAYDKCPYLKRMLDDMLDLAKAAGL